MTQQRTPMTDKDRKANQPYDIDLIPEPAKQSDRSKLANWLVGIALVIAAIGIGIILRWSFASENILEVNNSPFPARVIPDPTGKTGGIIFLNADFCKNDDVVGEIRISYVSKSREVFLPISKEQSPAGCDKREVPAIIPLDLVKDEYRIKFRVTYDINPLKKGIITNFESQPVVVGTNEPQ